MEDGGICRVPAFNLAGCYPQVWKTYPTTHGKMKIIDSKVRMEKDMLVLWRVPEFTELEFYRMFDFGRLKNWRLSSQN